MTVNKRVRFAYIMYLVVLAIQTFDVFVLRTQDSVFVSDIALRIFGIVSAVVVSAVMGMNLKKFCFRSYGFINEILWGFFYSVIPFALVYLLKYLYFDYRGYQNLVLTFRPTGFSSVGLHDNFLTLLVLYILSLLLIVVFKEIFYRGYLITQLAPRYGVNVVICIQTALYTLSFVPGLAYYLVTGKFDSQSKIMAVFLILGHLFYHVLCGIKWGLYYKVNGTVWMSVVDHFVNKFLITSFFFTEERLPEKWYIIEIIVIQIISILFFLPQYFRRDRMNELAAREVALSREAMKMGVDDYSPSVLRKTIGSFKRNSDNFNDGRSLVEFGNSEDVLPFDSSQFMNEDKLTLSVRGYEINDNEFEYNNEASDLDTLPSEKSKEFFDKFVGRAVDNNFETDNDTDSAQNISKLVRDYFNKNFDQHTFTKDKK